VSKHCQAGKVLYLKRFTNLNKSKQRLKFLTTSEDIEFVTDLPVD
jgi:hypothetical protein